MDTSSILWVALISATVGFITGALIVYLTGNKGEQEKVQPSQPLPSAVQVEPSPPEPHPQIFSLWREPPMGTLRIEMGGRTNKSAADLTEEERTKLRLTIADLETWLSVGSPAVLKGPSSRVGPLSGNQDLDSKISPEIQPDHPSMMAPLSTSLMSAATRAAAAATQASPTQSRSIATQIDDILQDQIAGSPLEKRGLRLVEIPNHGVAVIVDGRKFQGIDQVPDLEVRSAIKKAVQVWENQAS